MQVTRNLNPNECRVTALAYSKIYSDGINTYAAALAEGQKHKFIAWLTPNTVTYDASNKQVTIYPCIVVVDRTLLLIGGNLKQGYQPITISNVNSNNFKVYVTFKQDYDQDTNPPSIVISDQTVDGVLLAEVVNGQVKPVHNQSDYFLKLQNLPTIDAPWCVKNDWHCAGSVAVKSPDSNDVYISFHSPGSNKLHLVLDGDVYANEGQKQLAYNDLSNVDDTTVLDKVKAVDGSGSGLDADTLDGIQASSFVRFDKLTLTTKQSGWYRFAKSLVSCAQNGALYRILYARSGCHGVMLVWFGLVFGQHPIIHILSKSGYRYVGQRGITKLRIVYKSTYDPAYLEFYYDTNDDTKDPTYIEIERVDNASYGWPMLDSIQAGSVPSDYNVYEIDARYKFSFDNKIKLDFNDELIIPHLTLDAPENGWNQFIQSRGIIRLRPDIDNTGDPYIQFQDYRGNTTAYVNAKTGEIGCQSLRTRKLTVRGDGGVEIYSKNDSVSYIDFHGKDHLNYDYYGRLQFNDNNKIFSFLASGGNCRLSVDGKIIGRETISTSNPSGGLDGDKWFKV